MAAQAGTREIGPQGTGQLATKGHLLLPYHLRIREAETHREQERRYQGYPSPRLTSTLSRFEELTDAPRRRECPQADHCRAEVRRLS